MHNGCPRGYPSGFRQPAVVRPSSDRDADRSSSGHEVRRGAPRVPQAQGSYICLTPRTQIPLVAYSDALTRPEGDGGKCSMGKYLRDILRLLLDSLGLTKFGELLDAASILAAVFRMVAAFKKHVETSRKVTVGKGLASDTVHA